MSVFVDANSIKIEDAYTISHKEFKSVLNRLKCAFTSNVFNRSVWSLCCEWSVYNVSYKLGLFRSRTKDVDLRQERKNEWLFIILGTILYPFA